MKKPLKINKLYVAAKSRLKIIIFIYLYQVLNSFLLFLVWYSLFIIAFGLGFYIMLHDDTKTGMLAYFTGYAEGAHVHGIPRHGIREVFLT